MPSTTATNAAIGNRGIVVAGIVAGFFVVSFAANWSPEFTNGILLLILLGTLLGNANKWLPYLNKFGTAGSAAVKTPADYQQHPSGA